MEIHKNPWFQSPPIRYTGMIPGFTVKMMVKILNVSLTYFHRLSSHNELFQLFTIINHRLTIASSHFHYHPFKKSMATPLATAQLRLLESPPAIVR